MTKEKIVKVTIERHIPLFKKQCAVCGKIFEGAKLAKYCSVECRGRADYLKHAESRREKRRERYQRYKTKSLSKSKHRKN